MYRLDTSVFQCLLSMFRPMLFGGGSYALLATYVPNCGSNNFLHYRKLACQSLPIVDVKRKREKHIINNLCLV